MCGIFHTPLSSHSPSYKWTSKETSYVAFQTCHKNFLRNFPQENLFQSQTFHSMKENIYVEFASEKCRTF